MGQQNFLPHEKGSLSRVKKNSSLTRFYLVWVAVCSSIISWQLTAGYSAPFLAAAEGDYAEGDYVGCSLPDTAAAPLYFIKYFPMENTVRGDFMK